MNKFIQDNMNNDVAVLASGETIEGAAPTPADPADDMEL
jgi:hypothetical protein